MRRTRSSLRDLALTLAALALPSAAHAQTAATNQGFELNRYEPTAAGEWSFWVDHPWYSGTRYFAGGLTLNYAHAPLVLGNRSPSGDYSIVSPIITHRLTGHLDLAASFLDRVMVSVSLPVVLLERGDAALGITPYGGATVGDVRLGARVRALGQPYAAPISLSAGIDVWAPLGSHSASPERMLIGETGVRVMPKLMLGGLARRVLWSLTGAFLYRPVQSVGELPPNTGNTVGSEVQLGAALKYADLDRRLAVGPEALLATVVIADGVTPAFRTKFTSLEVLLGLHYNVAGQVQLGVAGGVGLLREPGTPDGRLLLRAAYAPMGKEPPRDRDGDGVPDTDDACPGERGPRTGDPATHGCPPPPPDSDKDGVLDAQDQCPAEAAGDQPDPRRLGCPLRDQDGDGVLDDQDQCVGEAAGATPDPRRPGCPAVDQDGDGVFDHEDLCPAEAAGGHPAPARRGCPDQDSDKDGVYDGHDQCKDAPAGLNPDASRPGCPLPDRDSDLVPDHSDACPDKAGAPSPDPRRNGCPGLVEVKAGQIIIREQVFFKTGKDEILKKSFPVLDSVAHTMKTIATIKKVEVEGHTDNKGKEDKNIDLSTRRARSVLRYLVDHGVAAERLGSRGYGPARPIADNKTEKGRALNRRVDFRIIDPPQADPGQSLLDKTAPAPAGPAQDGKPERGGGPAKDGAAGAAERSP